MTASHARRLDERELHLLRSACDTHQIALRLAGRAPIYPSAVETPRGGVRVVIDAEGATVGQAREVLPWERVAEHARLLSHEERDELEVLLRALGALDHTYPVHLPDSLARAHGIHLDGRGVAADDRQAYLELNATWRAARLIEFTDAKADLMASLEKSVAACLSAPGSRGAGGAPEEVALFDMDGLWSAPDADPDPRPSPSVTYVPGPHIDHPCGEAPAFPWGPA